MNWEHAWSGDGTLPAPTHVGPWNMLIERVDGTETRRRVTRTLCLVYVWNLRPLAIKRDGEHPAPGERIIGWREAVHSQEIVAKVFGR